MQTQRAWLRFSSGTMVAPMAPRALPHSSWVGFYMSWKRWWPTLLVGISAEVAHTLQSHIFPIDIEAQRAADAGGLQVQADQAADGGLHFGTMILTNLGAHG